MTFLVSIKVVTLFPFTSQEEFLSNQSIGILDTRLHRYERISNRTEEIENNPNSFPLGVGNHLPYLGFLLRFEDKVAATLREVKNRSDLPSPFHGTPPESYLMESNRP
ncbi:MAG: hypothetical protein PVJ38_08345, partial [Candidatus Bathyarchaeota archaeon]